MVLNVFWRAVCGEHAWLLPFPLLVWNEPCSVLFFITQEKYFDVTLLKLDFKFFHSFK